MYSCAAFCGKLLSLTFFMITAIQIFLPSAGFFVAIWIYMFGLEILCIPLRSFPRPSGPNKCHLSIPIYLVLFHLVLVVLDNFACPSTPSPVGPIKLHVWSCSTLHPNHPITICFDSVWVPIVNRISHAWCLLVTMCLASTRMLTHCVSWVRWIFVLFETSV